MIVIKIGDNQHKIVSEWNELTLDQAIKLSAIEMPDVDDAFDLFEVLDVVKQYWLLMSDVKQNTIDRVNPSALVHYFDKYMTPMIADLHNPTPKTYQPELIEEFTHEGVHYVMPKSLIIDEETIVLQHGQPVKCFIEASNLLKQFSEMKRDGIKSMPLFVASIVKRSHDELFDEAVVAERAKRFATLPMDIVWEVFFCTSLLTVRRLKDTLQSMTEAIEKLKGASRSRWDMKLGRMRSRKAELLEELKKLRG